MRTIGAARFKAHCLEIPDDVDPEGIIITKRGKPGAQLMPLREKQSHPHLIGVMEGEIIVDPNDDLFSTGACVSDEWGDLNNGPS